MSKSMAVLKRKLPSRYAAIVMPLVLSVIMTCVVSAITTLKSLGFSGAALSVWPVAWGLSWLVAFPVLLLALPVVRFLTALIVETAGTKNTA